MCGIVGAIAERNVTPILLEGLRRLEYRGYDSAGLVTIDHKEKKLQRVRTVGKVQTLISRLQEEPVRGNIGVAHTRWATHGIPCEKNAHPQVSNNSIAVVHNGIIENYQFLKDELVNEGYRFESDTDTEVIAHLVNRYLQKNGGNLLTAVRHIVTQLTGIYSLAVICREDPYQLVAVNAGSSLVLGIGIEEHFIASDVLALSAVTQNYIFLEDGDYAELWRHQFKIYDSHGQIVKRSLSHSSTMSGSASKGSYRHFMLKEIFEQPAVVAETLAGRIDQGKLVEDSFGDMLLHILDQVRGIHIVGCGTSYHAGLLAKYWLEQLGIFCTVEVASEYCYRKSVIPSNTLFISISQSGETADTLSAVRVAKKRGYLASLAICNLPQSSLVREADFTLLTRAGMEIGVASTKTFTTQLVVLRILALLIGKRQNYINTNNKDLFRELELLPKSMERILGLHELIEKLAEYFAEKRNALFLGRGMQYPIAMEGALKLKEISYIHAEAYPAGELKHGPLALVDADMPVVCIMPEDNLFKKLLSNIQEIRARGGELFIFSEEVSSMLIRNFCTHVLSLGTLPKSIAPILFSLPLQLLAYYVAVLKGTDVDQPRNLAKSVTVE